MSEASDNYYIWGVDDASYGPVELPVLAEWIADERVVPDTWVFTRRSGAWRCAADIHELADFFKPKSGAPPATLPPPNPKLKPGSLRRIKILAEMNDLQLAHLAHFMELVELPPWTVVCKQGEPGDAMFMVLAGELRARTTAGGKETILATFGPGDFFGDLALFDRGLRSADVIANVDSTVLKFPSSAFERLVHEAPQLAVPFMLASMRTLGARIRADNKRFDRIAQQFQYGR